MGLDPCYGVTVEPHGTTVSVLTLATSMGLALAVSPTAPQSLPYSLVWGSCIYRAGCGHEPHSGPLPAQ